MDHENRSTDEPTHRCLYLLIGLVALLTILPFFQSLEGVSRGTMALFSVVVLIAGIAAIGGRRKIIVALALGLPLVAMSIEGYFIESSGFLFAKSILGILFFGYLTVVILSHVLVGSTVTADKLFGAASAYLLIALTWTSIYMMISTLQTGAFSVGGLVDVSGPPWRDMLYYSFATLTTLGYGDILPMTPAARSLASLEAATGVLYIALLIARLVGMYNAASRAEDDN